MNVTVQRTYQLSEEKFESRTVRVEVNESDLGLTLEDVAGDPQSARDRLTYFAYHGALKVMVADGRYTVDEAKRALARLRECQATRASGPAIGAA